MAEKFCSKGHKFEKSSDCETCPSCMQVELRIAYSVGFPRIGSPAYFALKNNGIVLADLPKYSEKQLLDLHGVGPRAIRILGEYLKENGLSFARD